MASTKVTNLETILLASGDARVSLAPERGGIATRFTVGELRVFFLDEATLVDRSKNVRGGCPVLFPAPGKLEGDRFARDGREGSMGQHGFARNSAWSVVDTAPETATLELRSSDVTRAAYPWDFVATYRYTLRGRTLRIHQHIETLGDDPMPFGAGFHPYFELPQARKANDERPRIPTKATRAWDNAAKREIALDGPIDLTAAEVDLHLLDHEGDSLALDLGDGHRVEVRASGEFRTWVVWTLAGRDFVCVEPWTAPGNALNTGHSLLVARRGAPVDLWTEIAFL